MTCLFKAELISSHMQHQPDSGSTSSVYVCRNTSMGCPQLSVDAKAPVSHSKALRACSPHHGALLFQGHGFQAQTPISTPGSHSPGRGGGERLEAEPQNPTPDCTQFSWMSFSLVKNLFFFNPHTITESKTSPFSFTLGTENNN